jgi:hypothetical protein
MVEGTMGVQRQEKLLMGLGFRLVELSPERAERLKNCPPKGVKEGPFFWDMGETTLAVDEAGTLWQAFGSVNLSAFGFRNSSKTLNAAKRSFEKIYKSIN